MRALGRKYCAYHFQCVACQLPIMENKLKFAEWDSKPICIACWGELPLDIRKIINQYASFERKAKEDEKKKTEKSAKQLPGGRSSKSLALERSSRSLM